LEKKTIAANFVISTVFHIAAFAFLAFLFAKSNLIPDAKTPVMTVTLLSPNPQQPAPTQPQQQAQTPPKQMQSPAPRPELPSEHFIPKEPQTNETAENTDSEEISENPQTETGEPSETLAEFGGGETEENSENKGGGLVSQASQQQFTDAPTAIFMPRIPYPRAARNLNIEGKAEIAYVIDSTGRVRTVEILSMPHPSFENNIRRTVMSWRFTPAKKDGIPVTIRATQTIVFELQG